MIRIFVRTKSGHMQKVCEQCGTTFDGKATARFCRDACRKRYSRNRETTVSKDEAPLWNTKPRIRTPHQVIEQRPPSADDYKKAIDQLIEDNAYTSQYESLARSIRQDTSLSTRDKDSLMRYMNSSRL